MTIKTPEFDKSLREDLQAIVVQKRRGFREKGSYWKKPMGSSVTDIDTEMVVGYNQRLFEILASILGRLGRRRPRRLYFMRMRAGAIPALKAPWTIDPFGGCKFNLGEARDWVYSVKDYVPQDVFEEAKNIISSDTLKLGDLIKIENLFRPYSRLTWYEEDIAKGYLERHGRRYDLVDVAKEDSPVMKFLYVYSPSQMAPVDVALKDYKHPTAKSGTSFPFYMQDWYTALKSFRWKVKPEDRETYAEAMKEIEKLVALRYQLYILERLERSEKIPLPVRKKFQDSLDTSRTQEELSEVINKTLEDKVPYFQSRLKEEFRDSSLTLLRRSQQAQEPVSVGVIERRMERGVLCPFFPTDIEDFETIQGVATRLLLDHQKLEECVVQSAEKSGKTVREVLDLVAPNNGVRITPEGEKFVLHHGDTKVATLGPAELREGQIYGLVIRTSSTG